MAANDTDGGRDVAQPHSLPPWTTHTSQMCILTGPALSAMMPADTCHGPSSDHRLRPATPSRICVVYRHPPSSPHRPNLGCGAMRVHPPTL